MSFEITVEGGTSVRLPTAGKYCDRDIVVTATGGGGGVENYAKVYVKPTSTASITIENPLGGLAKCFTIRRLSETEPSSQKFHEFVGSYDPPIGAAKFASASNTVRYAFQRTSGSINNSYFKITEGAIQVYRYNTANTWDTASEYEVEIFGRVEESASTMMLMRDGVRYEEAVDPDELNRQYTETDEPIEAADE